MNDETKAAVESLRREMADGDPDWWKRERLIFNHIDGEPARLAAAREEQREACATECEDGETCRCDNLDSDAQCGHCLGKAFAETVRATPLDATPLADELRTLRARVAELEALLAQDREHVEMMSRERREAINRAEKAEAERAAEEGPTRLQQAEARVAELERALRPFALTTHAEQVARAEKAEADLHEAVEALRGLRDEVSAKLTGRDSEPGKFEAAWQTACAVLKKHPVKP